MKKLKNNGFTLIELLGCIVILSLLLVIVYPSLRGSTDDANNKNEEIFMKRLESVIESYISFNASSINFTKTANTFTKAGSAEPILIYASKNIKLQKLVTDKLISDPIINPSNKNKPCNLNNNNFVVYKDSDYVYCFYMKMLDNDCITGSNKIINTCSRELSTAMGLGA